MKLYIAEKPSLGRAIAEVLPKPHKKGDGFITVGNGDCVSWCIGHLLEQAEPDAYDAKFKQWQLEHLPIVPEKWQLKAKPNSRKQLAVLRHLVKDADELVHAGDPDREGQLLVDQVIDYLGVKGAKRASIQRCLINDLNPVAVTRALSQLRDNREFIPLSTSALARSRADWLYGINMTRAFTLQGRKVGYQGVLSVGRVQTPLLGLVVNRDVEIEHFVSKPFFQVVANLLTKGGERFKARWQPSEECLPWQDEEGRVLSRGLVDNVAARITHQPATVTSRSSKKRLQAPPLPYSLSSLQIDGAKRFGMSAKAVLDTCQGLYERHKLLTYPRSDSRYLPMEHLQERGAVLDAIKNNCSALSSAVSKADTSLVSKAWNDKKVEAHHAIIPTARRMDASKLTKAERDIYALAARQYLIQFYPPHESQESQIELMIAGGIFVAKASESLNPGWKQLFPNRGAVKSPQQEAALNNHLPTVKKGDVCSSEVGEIIAKETSPPKPFDDASLLAAMTGIARYVKDPEIRRVLKETDGLGTEATRASIIELLFTRGFLQRQGKRIRSTAAGKGLITSLPAMATTPDMTAQWETLLSAISAKETSYQAFMLPLEMALRDLIAQSQVQLPTGLKDVQAKQPAFRKAAKKPAAKRRTKTPAP
ncbi:MAG: DNA topoisomerase III [Gammaproteobacteria bacterium]|nr:DNA topoisomerase III [Gammaproteobacteria bacterium]